MALESSSMNVSRPIVDQSEEVTKSKSRFSAKARTEKATRIEDVTRKTLSDSSKALFGRSSQRPLWQKAGTMDVETFVKNVDSKKAEIKSLKSALYDMEVALKLLPQRSSEFKKLEGKYFQQKTAYLALKEEVTLLEELAMDDKLATIFPLSKKIQESCVRMNKLGVGKDVPDYKDLLGNLRGLPKDTFTFPSGKVVGASVQLLLTTMKRAEERIAAKKKPFFRKAVFEERRGKILGALRASIHDLETICSDLKIPQVEVSHPRVAKEHKLQDVSKQIQKLSEKTQSFLLRVSTGPFRSAVKDKCELKSQLEEIKKKCENLSTDVRGKPLFAFHKSVCAIGLETIENQLEVINAFLKKEAKDIADGFTKVATNIAKCSSRWESQKQVVLFSACNDLIRLEELVPQMEDDRVKELLLNRIEVLKSTIEHQAKTVLLPTEKEKAAAKALLYTGSTKDSKLCLEYVTKMMTTAKFFDRTEPEKAMTDCCLLMLSDKFKSEALKKMKEEYFSGEDKEWMKEAKSVVAVLDEFRMTLEEKTTASSAIRISEIEESVSSMPKESPFKEHLIKALEASKAKGLLSLAKDQRKKIEELVNPSKPFPSVKHEELNSLLSILMAQGLYSAYRDERIEARKTANTILDRYLSNNRSVVMRENDEAKYLLDNLPDLIRTGIKDRAREEQQSSAREAASIGEEFFPEEKFAALEMSGEMTSQKLLWTRYRSQAIQAAIIATVSDPKSGVTRELLIKEPKSDQENQKLLTAVRQHAPKWMSV